MWLNTILLSTNKVKTYLVEVLLIIDRYFTLNLTLNNNKLILRTLEHQKDVLQNVQ